LSIVINHSLQ